MTKSSSKSKSLWAHALDSLLKDRYALIAMTIVALYALVGFLTSVGLLASGWENEVGASYAPPSWEHPFGLDIFGRSVLDKALKGTEVAMSVGF